jgi:molecular chaperone DnaJ
LTQTKRDYYEILGLRRAAGEEEIRRAFRSRARELHPDVSEDPDAEDLFREVTAAYGVLSKPASRFLYDRFGYRGRGNGGFGSRRQGGGARVLAEVELDAFEADRGTRRDVTFSAEEACQVCAGSGAAPGTDVRECAACGGKGRLRVSSGLGAGRWLRVQTCPDCAGEGRIVEQACPECRGVGRITQRHELTVRIPPGVEDGTRLRVMGESEDDHLLVRVTPGPDDPHVIRWIATALLVCAVVLLAYFIARA